MKHGTWTHKLGVIVDYQYAFKSHVSLILCLKFQTWWLQNQFVFTFIRINLKHVQPNQISKWSQFDRVYAAKYCNNEYSNRMFSISVFMPAAPLRFLLVARVSFLLLWYILVFMPPVHLILSISLHDFHSCSPSCCTHISPHVARGIFSKHFLEKFLYWPAVKHPSVKYGQKRYFSGIPCHIFLKNLCWKLHWTTLCGFGLLKWEFLGLLIPLLPLFKPYTRCMSAYSTFVNAEISGLRIERLWWCQLTILVLNLMKIAT